jgi:hypothetical protein
MEKEFKQKIHAEIQKSGFPLELEITEKLRQQDHALVFSNVAYQSPDNSIKEIDIVAILQDEDDEWDIGPVGTQILIECKKSDKYPWVFFEDVYDPLVALGLLGQADYLTDLELTFEKSLMMGTVHSPLSGHYYNDLNISTTKTYFEAFKAGNEPTTIYKAVLNILHGRKFLRDSFVRQFESRANDKNKFRTFLKQYVIVYDGKLVIASKNGDDFDLAETNHLIIRTRDTIASQEQDYLGEEILIDVVKREYFGQYITLSQKGIELFNKHLKSIRNSDLFNSFVNMQAES